MRDDRASGSVNDGLSDSMDDCMTKCERAAGPVLGDHSVIDCVRNSD